MSRPEDLLPPNLFYNASESRKYTTSSRIQHIQAQMTYRALSLLNLNSPSLILDVGCGSGLSGAILSTADDDEDDDEDDTLAQGYPDPTLVQRRNPGGPHTWIGMDISESMLGVALENDAEGDLFLADAGQGIPFRPGTFDAAISISAIQWLCNVESSEESATGRLNRFFGGLYGALRRGGRAVCQFYPRDDKQKQLIASAAMRAGFGAGLLEDGLGTKNVKVFLVLTVGGGDITSVVSGMEGVDVEDARRKTKDRGKKHMKKGSKAWILHKKEQMERKGKVVKPSSKYTGRKRRIAF